MHRGENLLMIGNHSRGADAADVAARQLLFRHDDVQQMFAAGGRRVKHFSIGREIEAPGVATAGGHLFEGAAVGLETDDAGSDPAKILRAVGRFRMSGAVADRAVNPAVHAPAKVIEHRVRVERAETGVKRFNFVGYAIAVRVANPENVRRLGDDHAVFVKDE